MEPRGVSHPLLDVREELDKVRRGKTEAQARFVWELTMSLCVLSVFILTSFSSSQRQAPKSHQDLGKREIEAGPLHLHHIHLELKIKE